MIHENIATTVKIPIGYEALEIFYNIVSEETLEGGFEIEAEEYILDTNTGKEIDCIFIKKESIEQFQMGEEYGPLVLLIPLDLNTLELFSTLVQKKKTKSVQLILKANTGEEIHCNFVKEE
ncbi:MAG: hypothetical protein H8E55_18875 [Pelagibacterales bacterium]|nr:hypothetical protein [Pelagibacterales bacterium]